MRERVVKGYNFEIDGNHYYFFPGIVVVAFSEDPLYMEKDINPNMLERLLKKEIDPKIKKRIQEDRNIKKLEVSLSLVKKLEYAFEEENLIKALLTLREIEKYKK